MDSPRKVIWAVDPFEEFSPLQRMAADALIRMQRRIRGLVIEPLYVLSPAQLNLSMEFSTPWVAQYRPAAEKAMEGLCRRLGFTFNSETLRPKVIIQNFSSTSQAVATLADYAVKTGAELIVAGSHGRTGVKRLLLGSFAETLLLSSRIPVMIVGPVMRRSYDLGKIVFATDFGGSSDQAFRNVVHFAAELRASLRLFHAIPSPIEPVFQSGVYLLGGAWMPVHAYFAHETERHRKHAEQWAKWACAQGVQTESHIETTPGSIADKVIAYARAENAGMIAMDAHSGPIASSLLGSITRQVVRHADCPVWVIRSQEKARARGRSDRRARREAA
ncbi:MAG: hypothetical protein A2X94_14725 [Bdellovibrionales bacterium GWB1_55_8]|nr:MAG: hypothetical protein A2X94_14725 [Bdellovibrionales bacterium GWB1_55_8]